MQLVSSSTDCFPRMRIMLICLLCFSPLVVNAAEADSKPASPVQEVFDGAVPTSLDDLKAMEQHVKQLAERIIPCTVGVQVGPAQGSGVIIKRGDEYYVLTAAHVSGKPDRNVRFITSEGKMVRGKTLGLNRGIDSGLMKITDEGDWPHVALGNSRDLKEGQWVVGTGHPNGYIRGRKPSLRMGRVLRNRASVIVSDCLLVSGDSGGPLFNMQGEVVGIHSRIELSLKGNMHVPVSTYTETWDRLAAGELWGHLPGQGPFIGVQGDPEAEDARIVEVHDNTPAAKAGLEAGDVIIKFGKKDVSDFPSLAMLVQARNPGDKVAIQVRRGEETLTKEIVIGRRGG